jgi:hypothetical protein
VLKVGVAVGNKTRKIKQQEGINTYALGEPYINN